MGPGNFRFFNSSCFCQREGNQPLPSWTELLRCIRIFFQNQRFQSQMISYCWWKKSCTTWDVYNLVNHGTYYLSTGAGFQPSTVSYHGKTMQNSDLNDSRNISHASVSFVVLPNTTHVHLYIHYTSMRRDIICIYIYDIRTVYTYRGGFSATY